MTARHRRAKTISRAKPRDSEYPSTQFVPARRRAIESDAMNRPHDSGIDQCAESSLIAVVMSLHQDFWIWTDKRWSSGSCPIGLAYHAGLLRRWRRSRWGCWSVSPGRSIWKIEAASEPPRPARAEGGH